MNAAELKAMARKLSNAAWAAGKADDDDSPRRSQRACDLQDESLRALCAAIDASFPTLPHAQTVTLGDEFAEPHMADELTQKPMGAEDFILDLIADAKAHDERRSL